MDHICGWVLPSGRVILRSECAACNEEEVMTKQSNAELIAAHQFDSGNCTCGAPWHECSYAPYAERLEAADAADQRAAELAAGLQAVRDWASSAAYGEGDYYSGYDSAQGAVLDILGDTPADALREHDAALIEAVRAEEREKAAQIVEASYEDQPTWLRNGIAARIREQGS